MILKALSDAGGVKYLKARAVDTPASFLTLIGKVLPTTISGDPQNPLRTIHTITLSAGEFKPEHPASTEAR